MGRAGQFWLLQQNLKGPYLGKYFTKYANIWRIFLSDHVDQTCKFSSKSGGVPFQISFFWGDLTRNDPATISTLKMAANLTQTLNFKPDFHKKITQFLIVPTMVDWTIWINYHTKKILNLFT